MKTSNIKQETLLAIENSPVLTDDVKRLAREIRVLTGHKDAISAQRLVNILRFFADKIDTEIKLMAGV